MVLSADLLSQFAKITKDSSNTKKETTVYGTTVEYNNSIYVKLDGSDLLTPVYTTADTKAGERVTVMIKNHTATITGNISSPAARSGDVKDVSDTITNLKADNISIRESLTAANASIDNLEVENANIKSSFFLLCLTQLNIIVFYFSQMPCCENVSQIRSCLIDCETNRKIICNPYVSHRHLKREI